ncbi:hypothetical protein LRS06_22030 [Hymenobacter sp. J193]|uniref:hypothetical protein n=1 Tax=Hymenobacter sp. J193 TaxID=2898429 RepID=UPI002151645E|nr:hypothetical protein [Hymenobacter sp. J193]MCR5890410.1 hypothetical protein [Hymenobacter sp. J193]
MKLLAATNRYYLLLATVLFTAGSVFLYYGVRWTLQSEAGGAPVSAARLLAGAGAAHRPPARHPV